LASNTIARTGTFSLTVNPADLDGNLQSVQLFENDVAIGNLPLSSSTTNRTDLPAGNYSYYARTVDTGGLSAQSSTVSFTVANPVVSVAAQAPTNVAIEGSTTPGVFRFVRDGGNGDLVVNYEVLATSTASAGTDYTALTGSVTIASGAKAFAIVNVLGAADNLIESNETVAVRLLSGSGYAVSDTANQATVTIQDVKPPVVTIVNGNNQTGPANAFLAEPFEVLVTDGNTNLPLANKSVTFTVQTGSGVLSSATSGAPLAESLTVQTDANGQALAYYQQGTQGGKLSQISVYAGQDPSQNITLHSTTNFLVAHWTMEKSFGAAVTDLSGSGNSAVISNDTYAFWRMGYVGRGIGIIAVLYTGQTGLLVANTNNRVLPVTGQPFSFAFWFRANQLNSGTLYALGCNESYEQSGFRLGIDTGSYFGGNALQFWTHESGGTIFMRPAIISAERWYHVAVTYNGTTAKVYLDGVLRATQNGILKSNTNDIRFGAGIGGKHNCFGSA
jgi:hypothetical protein